MNRRDEPAVAGVIRPWSGGRVPCGSLEGDRRPASKCNRRKSGTGLVSGKKIKGVPTDSALKDPMLKRNCSNHSETMVLKHVSSL